MINMLQNIEVCRYVYLHLHRRLSSFILPTRSPIVVKRACRAVLKGMDRKSGPAEVIYAEEPMILPIAPR